MNQEEFKKKHRKSVGYDPSPLTADETQAWLADNVDELTRKMVPPPATVTVKDQNDNVVSTVIAPGEVTVLKFTGIKDTPISGNDAKVIDNPF